MELAGLTIHALHDKLVSGEVSAMALTEAVLTRLAAVEERVHAYITVTPELARQQAAAADEAFARGEVRSPLQGIPLAIKDNICTQGVRTTCASRHPGQFYPALRCHGNPAPAQRRGSVRRQGQHGRIRHGLLDGKFCLWAHAQSLG